MKKPWLSSLRLLRLGSVTLGSVTLCGEIELRPAEERFRIGQPPHLCVTCVTCVTRPPKKPEIQGKNTSPHFRSRQFLCVTMRHLASPNGSAMRNVSSFLFLFVPECCHYILYRKSRHTRHTRHQLPQKARKIRPKRGCSKSSNECSSRHNTSQPVTKQWRRVR